MTWPWVTLILGVLVLLVAVFCWLAWLAERDSR